MKKAESAENALLAFNLQSAAGKAAGSDVDALARGANRTLKPAAFKSPALSCLIEAIPNRNVSARFTHAL